MYDVLQERRDVLALMETSRALLLAGVPHLLGLGVVITSETALESFCRFLFRDLPTRGPLLRQLRVSIKLPPLDLFDDTADSDSEDDFEDEGMDVDQPEPRPSSVYSLTTILRSATRLRDVSLDYFEELLQREPGLTDALIQLDSLRRLRTTSFGLRALSVLPRIIAPIEEADIHQWFNGMETSPVFFDFLAPFRSTLKKLTIWCADLWSVNHEEVDCRFPLVHTLSLRQVNTSVDLEVLLSAFPNLRHLDLTDHQGAERRTTTVHLDHIRNRELDCTDDWHSFEHLSGDLPSLYALGLTRHVRRVDISDIHLNLQSLAPLHAVVAGTTPTHLSLHMGYHRGQIQKLTTLPALLHVADAQSITHFALDISANVAYPMNTKEFAVRVFLRVGRTPAS